MPREGTPNEAVRAEPIAVNGVRVTKPLTKDERDVRFVLRRAGKRGGSGGGLTSGMRPDPLTLNQLFASDCMRRDVREVSALAQCSGMAAS